MASCIDAQCTHITRHQHNICNAFVACTFASVVVLVVTSLGFSLPPFVALTLAAGEGSAVGAFVVMAMKLRRVRRPLVMMAKGTSLADKLPQVRSWMGMALKEELDKYIVACLLHHQQHRPLTEEYYVAALLYAVGPNTPLHLALTTIVTDDVVNNEKPQDHFQREAAEATRKWRQGRPELVLNDELEYIQRKLSELVIDWSPDAKTQEAINYYENILANTGQHVYDEVVFAQRMLAALKEKADALRKRYFNLGIQDRLDMLYDHPHPEIRREAKSIDGRAEKRRGCRPK